MAGGDLLFGREFIMTIGAVKIAINPTTKVTKDSFGNTIGVPSAVRPLRVDFKVEKTIQSSPNKATVEIYNVKNETRSAMQENGAVCIIEAGYVENFGQIFKGQLEYSNTVNNGTDWITSFQSSDGAVARRTSRINETFAPGSQIKAVLKSVAQSLRVEMGNASEAFDGGDFRKGITEFTKGVTLSGKSADILDKLTKTTGLEWSIQDGQLQVLKSGKTVERETEIVSVGSGMIGSPELGEKNQLKVTSLMRATFYPGQKIKISSKQFDGYFKIHSLTHRGSTWGNDWITEMECKEAK